MNRGYLFLLLSTILTLNIACDNEVELFGDITEIPVVYGLLSTTDTAQYIRLERSFADPETSAFVLAQDPNEVYYADARVDLIESTTGVRYPLVRVNAVDEGYVREEGDFLTDPNYLYKITTEMLQLMPGQTFTVEVYKEEELIATSTTLILNDSRFFSPRTLQGVRRISFQNGELTVTRWERVEEASNYAISFDMMVRQSNTVTGEQELFDLRWDATSLFKDQGGSSDTQEELIPGQGFFDFLQSEFDPEANVIRQMLDIDIRVTSYGASIGEYLDVINANTGITSAQEVPTFTNIENGLGLFSSINETVLEDLSLTPRTLDSLYNGSTTADLNFRP